MAKHTNAEEKFCRLSYEEKQQVLERQNYKCTICHAPIIGRCVFHHVRNRKEFDEGDPLRDHLSNYEVRHKRLCEHYAHSVDRTGNPLFSRIWNGLLDTDDDTSVKCQLRHPYGCLDPKRKDRVRTRVKNRPNGCYQNGYKDLNGISYSRKKILVNQELVDAITEDSYFVDKEELANAGIMNNI